VRTLPWQREELIDRIRADIWRYLTQASTAEEQLLEAAALLQMPATDLRALGGLQFLVSEELRELLDGMPVLLRRLATTTLHEEEWSLDRIRGSIQWARTIGLRNATGLPHLYVTAPSRRAYQTPENQLLVFLLDETVRLGRVSGWHRSTSEAAGRVVSTRVGQAERWQKSRMLAEVERGPITPRLVSRVRSGRSRRRYQAVLNAFDRYRQLIGVLDRAAVQEAVERHGLVSRDDPTLFELVCTFAILKALKEMGWELDRLRLFEGSLRIGGKRASDTIEVTYQSTPRRLSAGSLYREVQRRHGVEPGGLIPDLVLRRMRKSAPDQWLLVEAKGGHRSVKNSARAAAYDLLAYRMAFSPVLNTSDAPYGLGVAWGADFCAAPHGDMLLCTPDMLPAALAPMFG
jgi:hypothetical protein